MEEKTTPEEGHSEEEVKTESEDVNEAGNNVGEQSEEGRKLDPEEMQKTLSRQFTEIDKLKKEIEDTKAGEDSSKRVSELEKRLQETEFFAENPEYKQHKDLIKRFGENPEEVVKSEEFQNVYSKIAAYDQSASVLNTNSRLAQVNTDTLEKAKRSLSTEDWSDVLKERGIN